LNIQGLAAHIDAFELALESEGLDPAIITFCEHWLSPDSPPVANKLKKYKLMAIHNRESALHGGVCILIRNDIYNEKCITLTTDSTDCVFECVAVELQLSVDNKQVKCIVVVLYRTPNSDFNTFIVKFENLLSKLSRLSRSKMIFITGDFNINLMTMDSKSRRFISIINSYNFQHVFSHPTRITEHSATCIDNIITNLGPELYKSEVKELGVSDHCSLNLFLYGRCRIERKTVRMRMVTNPLRISQFLGSLSQEDWVSCLRELTASGAYEQFFRRFHSRFLEHFPFATMSSNCKESIPKHTWMTQGLKISCINKKNLFEISKVRRDPEFLEYFKNYKRVFKKTVKAAKKIFNRSKLEKSKNIPKTAWEIVRQETGMERKNEQCHMVSINGRIVTDCSQICNLFNESFSSVSVQFGQPASTNTYKTFMKDQTAIKSIFNFRQVGENEIIKIIKGFDMKNSSGWDEIPMSLVKESSSYISKPLTHIVNLILRTGIYPDKLKFSVVTPVFKSGDRTDVHNYRPIALTPTFSKVIEKVIFDQVAEYFESNFLFDCSQFGFRKGRSVSMAAFELVTEVARALDGRQSIMGVFCDLSKAFDCVNLDVLLGKLHCYGITGLSGRLFETYLLGRSQKVKIQDVSGRYYYSEWQKVVCGVPQGSLLGPLLFLVYVNDLPRSIPSKLIMFADDTTAIVRGANMDELKNSCADTMNALSEWFRVNCLKLNQDKTNVVAFSSKNRTSSPIDVTLASGEHCLPKSSVKFLGLYIDGNLDWSTYFEHLIRKLGRALHVMNVLHNVVDLRTALFVYHGYFLSQVRYGILFWGSSSFADAVLKLQKRALRLLYGLNFRDSCRPYFKQNRLLTVYAIYIYELLKFMIEHNNYFLDARPQHGHGTRNRGILLYPRHRLTMFERSPYYMILKVFNNLPSILKQDVMEKHFLSRVKSFLIDLCPYSLSEFLNFTNNS
jgi:hypothetical protein